MSGSTLKASTLSVASGGTGSPQPAKQVNHRRGSETERRPLIDPECVDVLKMHLNTVKRREPGFGNCEAADFGGNTARSDISLPDTQELLTEVNRYR